MDGTAQVILDETVEAAFEQAPIIVHEALAKRSSGVSCQGDGTTLTQSN